jgi:hypothetical protein
VSAQQVFSATDVKVMETMEVNGKLLLQEGHRKQRPVERTKGMRKRKPMRLSTTIAMVAATRTTRTTKLAVLVKRVTVPMIADVVDEDVADDEG